MEQLAAEADVSVDTVRFYQSRGLLPPPRREGRIALYGGDHLARLSRIRALQARGLTLATIRRLLDGELDPTDEALLAAVSASQRDDRPGGGAGDPGPLLSLGDLAVRTGIPVPLLQAVEREGLLVPRRVGAASGYGEADVEVAGAGLRLLEMGLPLHEILALARQHDTAMRAVAHQAVELFDAHVRQPLRTGGTDSEAAAARLVEAFTSLLPATTTLVAHHFRRTLLTVAQEHIEHVGDDAERAAVARQAAVTS